MKVMAPALIQHRQNDITSSLMQDTVPSMQVCNERKGMYTIMMVMTMITMVTSFSPFHPLRWSQQWVNDTALLWWYILYIVET
jgi:hypothetical protein